MYVPDLNTEYYLYQMLLALWPEEEIGPGVLALHERLWCCLLKAIREAGVYTDWRHPHAEYEEIVKNFLFSILSHQPDNAFYSSFLDFVHQIASYGKRNSLSAVVLRMGSCGIVDVYQGDENWRYTAMDPDNRQPLAVGPLLQALEQDPCEEFPNKVWVIQKMLRLRQHYPDLFLTGAYIPLKIHGPQREHIIAFLRRFKQHTCLVIVGRFFTQLPDPPVGRGCWGETHLLLPHDIENKIFTDVFTGKTVIAHKKGRQRLLYIADLFHQFPFAFLVQGILFST